MKKPPTDNSASVHKEMRVFRRSRRSSKPAAKAPLDSLVAMAGQLAKLQGEARKLGIFVGDRELIACPTCGLMEDELVDGRLVTCHEIGGPDTGMRFAAHPRGEDKLICPECGTVLRPQWL